MRLDRQFEENREAFMNAVETVFTHGRVLQGKEVVALEERTAALFGLAHGACVGSGTDALILALKALNMKPGAKVAVTGLTFVASASCIVHAGGTPVFVDIDADHYLNREDALLSLIESGDIDGIIVVHLYGQMMDLARVHDAARAKGVFIIEDAAQALGATRNGVAPGKCSDITCCSFDPTKVIGAQGSGGICLSDDEALIARIRKLRYHGHARNRVYDEIGHNSQLPTVQAAIINAKLDREEDWRKRRQAIAARYTTALSNIEGIQPPMIADGNEHIFHKYVMYVDDHRDDLAAYLKEKGIGTSVHYSMPLDQQPCFAGNHEVAGNLDMVADACAHVLSLPIYPELTDEEVEYICAALGEY